MRAFTYVYFSTKLALVSMLTEIPRIRAHTSVTPRRKNAPLVLQCEKAPRSGAWVQVPHTTERESGIGSYPRRPDAVEKNNDRTSWILPTDNADNYNADKSDGNAVIGSFIGFLFLFLSS